MNSGKPYLTAQSLAKLLMVSTNTLRLWSDKGLLRSETTLGGHRRYPRAEVERLLSGRASALARPASAKPHTVLIIEDREDLAQTLADGLRTAEPGWAVHVAMDGFAGGMKASLHLPDIVLLDLKMPGMDGEQVCRMLKNDAATRHVRVIAYTGQADAQQVQAVLKAGAEQCLFKPLRPAHILEAIGRTQT